MNVADKNESRYGKAMKTINLFLTDMNVSGNTSGVDRYLSVLMDGLKRYPHVSVCRINFRHDPERLLCSETEKNGYREVVIPMPLSPDEMISKEFWTDRYNAHVYHITRHLFEGKENVVFHLHTLNLMDFALTVKKHHPGCRIVTHLHCIPWKSWFNSDTGRFNRLYRKVYVDKEVPGTEELVSNHCELRSYREADRIVCVTRCAGEFLMRMMDVPAHKICVISNGISDKADAGVSVERGDKCFRFLYVGVITPSKGLAYILEAMRKIRQQGYDASLVAIGKGSKLYLEQIKTQYADVPVHFTGSIPFEELKGYYRTCDAGVIASLQEQCSYVAIEMAMFGLPVITTAVDGLDEMFIHGENALKVSTRFSRVYGLSVDVEELVKRMKQLMDENELRKKLGINARKRYEECFALEDMMERTVDIYNDLTNE